MPALRRPALRRSAFPDPTPLPTPEPSTAVHWTVWVTATIYTLSALSVILKHKSHVSLFVPQLWSLLFLIQLVATAWNQYLAALPPTPLFAQVIWMVAFGPLYVWSFLTNMYLLSYWTFVVRNSDANPNLIVWLLIGLVPATAPIWVGFRNWDWGKRLLALTFATIVSALFQGGILRPQFPERLSAGVAQFLMLVFKNGPR